MQMMFASLILILLTLFCLSSLTVVPPFNYFQLDIAPGTREAFLVSRNRRENHGTLAYNIGTRDLRMIVMWTSGMNFDHFANILGLGLTSDLNTDKFRKAFI